VALKCWSQLTTSVREQAAHGIALVRVLGSPRSAAAMRPES
jgi:hypothetical protein